MLQPTQEAKLLAKLRQALGADRFDQAFSAGSRLNQHEAVAAVRDRRGTGPEVPRRTPARSSARLTPPACL